MVDITARGLSQNNTKNVETLTVQVANVATQTMEKYGISYKISTDTVTRIGNSIGKVANISGAGTNDFDNIMPWAGMRRCNLADNLTVNAYYGDVNYKEDGSNGQVMVEVPCFYYSRALIDSDTIETYISMLPIAGYKLHPWFFDKSGNPVKKRYFSAYEGSAYDVSAGIYITDDAQSVDFTTITGDKLCSVAGVKTLSGKSQSAHIVNCRKIANNRGSGWEQQYFTAVSAIQMLLMVEYGSLNSQAVIGQGVVNITDTPNTTNNSIITGSTSFLGNKSGKAVGTDGRVSISYRGVENFWGNIWKWVDGFNISNGVSYISNINGNFASDIFTGQYVSTGFNNVNTDGWISKVGLTSSFNYGFIPTEVLGTSSSRYADYLWRNIAGAFVAHLGGSWYNGAGAGAFSWYFADGSGSYNRTVGARLCA